MLVNWCLEKQGVEELLHVKVWGRKYQLQKNVHNTILGIDAVLAVLCAFEKSQKKGHAFKLHASPKQAWSTVNYSIFLSGCTRNSVV